jgi:hypothetical protein
MVQLAMFQMPWTRSLFSLGALSAHDCALALGLALIPVTVLEVRKLLRRGT